MIPEDIIRDIRKRCRLAMNGVVSESMRNKGVNYKLNFGLSLQKIKEIATDYIPNKELAEYLWTQDVRELKILATFLYPVDEFTEETATKWEKEIPNQEIREQICFNLFQNLPFTEKLVHQWTISTEETTRITGYWLLSRMIIAKKIDYKVLISAFPYIFRDITSKDIFLRNAAVTALKQIGRQSEDTAKKIIDNISYFENSGIPLEKEIFENITFEFEFYFETDNMKDKYGIIGKPLGHSFSQKYFTEKFGRENINAEYLKFELADISELKEVLEANPELKGINVTIPYKEQVIPFLDEIDENARQIGAINVIRIRKENGKTVLKGFNSDIYGFMNSISPLLNPSHKKALILGTGGASKAVLHGLHQLGVESMYVSRTKYQNNLTYTELNKEILEEYTVIVNASPVGTFPDCDAFPDIPYEYISDKHLLYDLVYNPEETAFMKKGKEKGALTKNGQEMLELQAIKAWEMWNS